MWYAYKTCPCGELKGIGTDSYLHFKSVRYARAQRREAPEEVTGWEGVYDATVPIPYYFQYNSFIAEKQEQDNSISMRMWRNRPLFTTRIVCD